MAKLYWTSEVKTILEEKIQETADQLINDETMTDTQIALMIRQIRLLRSFAAEVIAGMKAADKAEDERREAEKKEAEKGD